MIDPGFLKREHSYTQVSEVFSVGSVLYYLMAGRRLIEGGTQKELFDKNLTITHA